MLYPLSYSRAMGSVSTHLPLAATDSLAVEAQIDGQRAPVVSAASTDRPCSPLGVHHIRRFSATAA